MQIHLSVQANTTNAAAVRFWQRQGVARVILSRELSLAEIAEIRESCPDMELEVFVHGALCIAYSGRCLLSGYFNHRDANQGTCTNACRWEYRVARADGQAGCDEPVNEEQPARSLSIAADDLLHAPPADADARHPAADEVWLLEEAQRPGEYMPVFEDENGTYIMNARDLRAVEHVQQLVAMGIDCLKIEGRTKSHYYAARTARVYRQAIDDAASRQGVSTRAVDGTRRAREPRLYRGFLPPTCARGAAELRRWCVAQSAAHLCRRGADA